MVIRITGPTHNYLAIELNLDPLNSEISVVPLESKTQEASPLTAQSVKINVLRGVSDANDQFGTNYTVKRIEFIPDDSPPVEIYQMLAKRVIERLVKGEPFANA